jgi:two-component sensor histidine kinase/PAS domain-containing protein
VSEAREEPTRAIPSPEAVRSGRSVAFRRRLWQLALGLALPAIALAAAGLYSAYLAERRATETLLRETTRALAGNVDRELARAEATLRALTESHYLRTSDYAAFHERAKRLTTADQTWIFLATSEGQPLLNTNVPYGQSLPPSRRTETFQAIARTGRAQLSDVFTGGVSSRPIAVLEVPVRTGETVTHVLGMALAPSLFQRIVEDQRLPENWNGAVLDGSGNIVARSRGTERFAGQPARPGLVAALRASTEGSVESVTLDGTPARSFFSRSPTYGWTFVIGYPKAEFAASLARSLGWLAALIAAALGGLALAALYARSLLEPVDRLAASARALGQGQRIDSRPTGVTELDAVASALVDAERDLQRRERDRDDAQAKVRESEETLRLALSAGRLGARDYDGGGRRFVLSESCAAIFSRHAGEPVDLAGMADRVHEEDRPRFEHAMAAALADGAEFDLSFRLADASRWVDLRGRRVDRGGRIALVGVAQDVTDRHLAEERQRLLIHELNHRVKNTLATVQSIAFMTYRSTADPATLWERFADRLTALAKTHDLLTAQDWTGAELGDVLGAELAPFQDESGRRISLEGAAVSLSPNAVLALGLVVHELATNAVKYGSLSAPAGGVTVAWSVLREGSEARLVIEWTERGGPPVAPPTRKGFGSRLIERSIAQQLGGRLTLDYEAAGLHCLIDLPFDGTTAQRIVPLRPSESDAPALQKAT